MIYKIEQLKNEKYDFLLNGTLYFSIIGEDENGDLQIDHKCEHLTNQESAELISTFINNGLELYLLTKMLELENESTI